MVCRCPFQYQKGNTIIIAVNLQYLANISIYKIKISTIINIQTMTSILLKQFIQGRTQSFLSKYAKIMGMRTPRQLDNVIPNLTENLFTSTEAFIDGLINLDEEFIQSTSTPSLQRILLPQIQKAKNNHIVLKQVMSQSIKQINEKLKEVQRKTKEQDFSKGINQRQLKRFCISPYVIFGQTMEERIKEENPWVYNYPILGLNRFINANSSQGTSLRNIMTDHIYGFHCYYKNLSKDIQVTEGSASVSYPPQEFVVTFQTNAENHEFYVSDLNYLVKEGF